MPVIITGTWTGQLAADLRAASRMPITEFAARTGIAERTISLWERKLAGITPSPEMQQVLDATLTQCPDPVKDRFAVLCAQRTAGTPQDGWDDMASDMNRRALLRTLTVTAAAVALGDAVDAARIAGSGPREYSPALLGEYAKVNARLWRAYSQAVPKRAVLPLVNTHLTVLTSRLSGAPGAARARLCALASDLFQLAGEVMFDGDRYTDAAHCYTLAADMAREARDSDLWACALTRHSFIYVYDRHHADAVPMLDAATVIASRGDRSQPAWQWASCVRAQALAGTGDLAGCEQALEDACTVADLAGPTGNGGWLRFDGSRLSEERGGCYTLLGRPGPAARALEDALAGDLSPRRRGSVHADLAATGLQRGDVGEFGFHADAALKLAAETGSGYVARRLRAIVPQSGPLSDDPRVRDISEQITTMEAHA